MPPYLTTGGPNDPFLPRLLEAIRQANEIDFAVAFIKASGLELLYDALSEAVTVRKARLRVLTSDYLDVTDPQALRMLMLLGDEGAEVRVHEAGSGSFHLKAYICVRTDGEETVYGTAFVGSSNISATALQDGLEWNYRIGLPNADHPEPERFDEIRNAFVRLFNNPNARPLDHAWIEAYEQRRQSHPLPVAPGSDDPELPPPEPTSVQQEALAALAETRRQRYARGLVVMATGLGKTYLAAFDSQQMNAGRVLFVAHREEILLQAENTFQRIRPRARVGRYTGTRKDDQVDLLFASVQTLGQAHHLERFAPGQFDYIVVDEFHHAAANTYRRLLNHFQPRFLLGLTATPERTDQSDILSLCDDNLVYTCDLFQGVNEKLLCPFTYYGIHDESVEYDAIPWRNGRFDPDALSNKLATLARARHAWREWQEKRQRRTLAFCVSQRHADFMADHFRKEGIKAAAAYAGSKLGRGEALDALREGQLEVIFSVDLFNEGVDLPAIDTVMMLRPTESKILFLQQLGRGLRRHEGKERLVVLDFIGNHRGFLNKPQALFNVSGTYRSLAAFARKAEQGKLQLPEGCYVNYDLAIINFLKRLDSKGIQQDYQALKDTLGRRPTLAELYRAGVSMPQLRKQYGHWWALVQDQGDLSAEEEVCFARHADFFRDMEVERMNKSFKMVLLESLLENGGFLDPPKLEGLSSQALDVFRRRRSLIGDIIPELQDIEQIDSGAWHRYWSRNPIHHLAHEGKKWFETVDGRFRPRFPVEPSEIEPFESMLQELVDYRLADYQAHRPATDETSAPPSADVVPFPQPTEGTELPYFPNVRIACGYFRVGRADTEEYRTLGPGHGRLDPARHFIARAIGDSMNGGKHPIHDGDYLLLERMDTGNAGAITGSIVVIERQDTTGDDQYLLRKVTKTPDGHHILKATNPDYPDYTADETMRTLARLRAVLDPLELATGQTFMREEIPELFGESFNPGNWHAGHVVLNHPRRHILLVTLNKQGKSAEHRYHDYFIDEHTFHWQSQNRTTPESAWGREIIEHEQRGIEVHLFVREQKLIGGKAAPFRYIGQVRYQGHQGSGPMNVIWSMVQ
ncbi:DUF3427 domain-containing protein [Thiohalomonas denitrificans]|uniref:DUF3427 domain-containing protein n=1 Tax=Thiohalomonas denitrificans TaxID=415747 RepID=UPI0026F3310D|nr:DUF3427 domain-containing protein [Thiohalomonas denitrificans]